MDRESFPGNEAVSKSIIFYLQNFLETSPYIIPVPQSSIPGLAHKGHIEVERGC